MPRTLLERFGSLFYVVDPREVYKTKEDVPNYAHEAVPLFFFLILMEAGIKLLQGKQVRVNEAFSSLAAGILHESTVFISGTIMFLGYEWLYERRFFDLPWQSSTVTWFAIFLFVDFLYYWIHRANHEVNVLWAFGHQMHHSAEDYTLATGLRISIFQRVASCGFYQPLALLGFPFPPVMAHVALNFIVQFWVHTDLIKTLGPLEYIFMTPSHHRVHHGSNKWCLDKNYASVFIIWDRIFGTFEAERPDEPIVYGLTDQLQSHNAIYHEFYHIKEVILKAKNMDSWRNTLRALFYGPGWVPGSPRLGDPETFPDIKAPRTKYNPILPLWQIWYCVTHLFLILIAQQLLVVQIKAGSSWLTILMFVAFIFVSVGIFGGMYDGRWWAAPAEVARCVAYTSYARMTPVTNIAFIDSAFLTCYAISMLIWTSKSLLVMKPFTQKYKLA